MTKLIACVCIMVSAVVFGYELSRSERKKLDTLCEICKALEMLQGEMSARPTLMCDMCHELAQKCNIEVKTFFESVSKEMACLGELCFAEIWERAIKKNFCDLDRQQMRELKTLGEMLGAYQLEEQLRAIKICKEELEFSLKQSKEKYEQAKKLFIGIPCSLAAMLLVVLI